MKLLNFIDELKNLKRKVKEIKQFFDLKSDKSSIKLRISFLKKIFEGVIFLEVF